MLLDLYLPVVFDSTSLAGCAWQASKGDAIVISAANESEKVERAVKLGAVNYLLKPFTADDLVQRLHQYRESRPTHRPRTLGGQAEADQILGRGDNGRSDPLPKGLSPETAESILDALATAGTLSAQECADTIGIACVSARRYLEFFVAQKRVTLALRYGARGRPERRYTTSRRRTDERHGVTPDRRCGCARVRASLLDSAGGTATHGLCPPVAGDARDGADARHRAENDIELGPGPSDQQTLAWSEARHRAAS